MSRSPALRSFLRRLNPVSPQLSRPPLRHVAQCQNGRVFQSHQARTNAPQPRNTRSNNSVVGPSFVALAFFATCLEVANLFSLIPQAHAEAPPKEKEKSIRIAEVHEHGRNAERRWVMRGNRVYDIEEWIPNHPGGEVILRAAGGTIDAFWDIFTIHKKQDVYDILEQYFIGLIDERDLVDGRIPQDHVEDPFKSDPKRDPSLVVLSEKPFNAETPVDELIEFITPVEKHYVRHHLWVPELANDEFTLTIELPDGEEKEYSVQELKSKFKQYTVTATLQCSGNRRKDMTTNARPANGLQWNIGAISNSEWTGVRLRDVLSDAGFEVDDVPEDVKHVQFLGSEAYGSSVPIEKVVDRYGDVLLVFQMNGKPLTPDHGYPLRVLVPGYVAARSVKWISKIVLSEDESTSQWQQRDYKCFGPNQGGRDIDWSTAPAIQETPVQSAIVKLENISTHDPSDRKLMQVYGLEEDSVVVQGYAYAGGGRRIARVDVSTNNGRTWKQAELLNQERQKGCKAWSWTNWRIVVPSREMERLCVVKAVDEGNNVQPETYEPHYNFRGNLTNAWHRVKYSPRDSS